MSDARSLKTGGDHHAILARCVVWAFSLGATIPALLNLAWVLEGPNLTWDGVAWAVGGTFVVATYCSVLAGTTGSLLAPLLFPPSYMLVIPPKVEAIARERFNVSGDAGPQDGVMRGE